MPNYNSTARVPFKHGGSVKKAEGGRIEFKKGSARTKRQAAAAEIFKAKAKSKGGETDFDFSGYPQTSKYRKALTKHEKEFPKLTKNIEADAWAASQSKKGLSTYGHWPKKVKRIHKRSKKAEGGRIEFKKGGKARDRHPPKKSKGSSIVDIFKSYGKYKGEPIELKEGGKVSDRHPPSEKEKRAQRQADYIKKHGKPEPRRKTLAVTDKYKKLKPFTRKATLPKVRPQRHGIRRQRQQIGGIIGLKKGGKADNKWIQKATKGMRKDKPCTGKKFGSATCPPGSKRYNLAQTFKKMARSKHASGGLVRYI
jgi:hypothetical protein